MAEKKYNKNNPLVHFEDDDDVSSTGTTAAGIEFQDFLLPSYQPEEKKLTAQENKQLLIQHAHKNIENVKRQKEVRDYYEAGKKNKNKNKHRQGYGFGSGPGQGYGHNTKPHPLTQTVHFGNGAEPKVTSIPSEQVAETNNEQRHELDLTLQNQNRLRMDPQTPRLKPPGA